MSDSALPEVADQIAQCVKLYGPRNIAGFDIEGTEVTPILKWRYWFKKLFKGRKMFEDLDKKLREDPELKKHHQQEKLILDVTELIANLMKKRKVNKTKLAELLGVGNSYVTQLLDGTTNMTLRTISDVFTSLDSELVVKAGSLSLEVSQSNEYETEDETQFVVEVSLQREDLYDKAPAQNDPRLAIEILEGIRLVTAEAG